MEDSTVHGFDIPLRQLTNEEKNRDLTIDRIREFHYAAGEDFLDQVCTINMVGFVNFLLKTHPNLSKEILKVINKALNRNLHPLKATDFTDEIVDNEEFRKDLYLLEVKDFTTIKQFGYSDKIDNDKIYIDYCNFVNLDPVQKAIDNQVLIQVVEYYTNII